MWFHSIMLHAINVNQYQCQSSTRRGTSSSHRSVLVKLQVSSTSIFSVQEAFRKNEIFYRMRHAKEHKARYSHFEGYSVCISLKLCSTLSHSRTVDDTRINYRLTQILSCGFIFPTRFCLIKKMCFCKTRLLEQKELIEAT